VSSSDARAQLLERRQRIGPTVLVYHLANGAAMPVRSLQEVDKIDPQRVFSLTHLPVLAGRVALQLFAKLAHLLCQRFVSRSTCQKATHPAHAERRRLVLDELGS